MYKIYKCKNIVLYTKEQILKRKETVPDLKSRRARINIHIRYSQHDSIRNCIYDNICYFFVQSNRILIFLVADIRIK